MSAGAAGVSQGDRGGLGSVLRDLVKPGDENLREMNKKLQNMLEEQLTKNMHLQKVTHAQTHTQRHMKCDVTCSPLHCDELPVNTLSLQDLELLSQELVRLSKENSPGGGAPGSG